MVPISKQKGGFKISMSLHLKDVDRFLTKESFELRNGIIAINLGFWHTLLIPLGVLEAQEILIYAAM
jgi:hypothetical protein